MRIFLPFVIGLLSATVGQAEDRYPLYLPEWLWRDNPTYSKLIDADTKGEWQILRLKAEQLDRDGKSKEAEKIREEAVKLLHGKLSARDFVRGSILVTNDDRTRTIALQLDPVFPSDMKTVLVEATKLYLGHATDIDIASDAIRESVENAEPFPSELIDGEPNPQHWLFSSSLSRPLSADAFTRHLGQALSPPDGSTSLLIVSSYSGGPWWGGGIYDLHNYPQMRLSRLETGGHLYIRLSTDKMKEGQIRHDDPKFWASKMAHEILHNLGYWHPSFADPAERDRVSTPGKMAFMVAYERALLAKLDRE